MGNNQRRVQLTSGSLAELQKERFELIGNHLEQMGNITSIINQQVDLALQAELRLSGVPVDEETQQEVVDRCEQMGQRAALARLKRYNEGVLDICNHLNVRDLPEFVTWAALKSCGVQLPVTEQATPEAKLVTER